MPILPYQLTDFLRDSSLITREWTLTIFLMRSNTATLNSKCCNMEDNWNLFYLSPRLCSLRLFILPQLAGGMQGVPFYSCKNHVTKLKLAYIIPIALDVYCNRRYAGAVPAENAEWDDCCNIVYIVSSAKGAGQGLHVHKWKWVRRQP